MASAGDSIYLFGGWHPLSGELGDLYRLYLAVDSEAAEQAAGQVPSPLAVSFPRGADRFHGAAVRHTLGMEMHAALTGIANANRRLPTTGRSLQKSRRCICGHCLPSTISETLPLFEF